MPPPGDSDPTSPPPTGRPGGSHGSSPGGRRIGRRALLVTGAVVGGTAALGLAAGVVWLNNVELDGPPPSATPGGIVQLNAYVAISPDGHVTIAIPRTEMGQGIFTGLAQLVAEELEVDLAGGHVTVAHPVDPLPVYANATLALDARPEEMTGTLAQVKRRAVAALPYIGTGGSTGVVDGWVGLRRAGAAARTLLLEAGAIRLGVKPDTCRAEVGRIVHTPSGRSLPYGELAALAATRTPPADPPLKSPDAWHTVGRAVPRLDIPAKVEGTARFGIDITLPGMLHAALVQPPGLGARVLSVGEVAARAVPGVLDIVDLGGCVAVVADSWWRARQGADALVVEWQEPHPALSTAAVEAALDDGLRRLDARVVEQAGAMRPSMSAATVVDATYATPFVTHACLEPMNCTVLWQEDGDVEVWCPTQSPTLLDWAVKRGARLAGRRMGTLTAHVTYAGGGFGRRTEMDEIVQATAIAARHPGRPVKLVWTREQDIRNGYLRTAARSRLRAVLGPDGLPHAWFNRIAAQSLSASFAARNLPLAASGTEDRFTHEGATGQPYRIPNRRVEMVDVPGVLPLGFWRSNGYANNIFFTESFLDECAHAAGRDPLDYRRALLAHDARALALLDRVAEAAGWGMELAPGPAGSRRGRGIAYCESFRSRVAQVAEVTVAPDGAIRVDRVVCAIDCGRAINPDLVAQQMEGSILWGLSTALLHRIEVVGGGIVQSNFHDYPLLTLADSPTIEVLVMESVEPPGGVGEPGVPPAAPALANAIFAATGVRLRSLPLDRGALALETGPA